jgi:chemotaxis regulatin CheY-phosphate phosphatase CheZ
MDQKEVNSLLERPKPNDALTIRAYRIIERWLEWARMHGHLDHAEGIVKDSRELIANSVIEPTSANAQSLLEKGPTK